MTNYFKPDELPGGNRAARLGTDTSTWRKVWQTAGWILKECVKGKHVAGWEFIGEFSSASVPPAFEMFSIRYAAFSAILAEY